MAFISSRYRFDLVHASLDLCTEMLSVIALTGDELAHHARQTVRAIL